MEEDNLFLSIRMWCKNKKFWKTFKKYKNSKFLGVNYRLCEYNATHIIRNELYETHLLSCQSKKKFDEEKIDSSDDDDLIGKFSDSEEEEEEKEKKEETKVEKNKDSLQRENKVENEDNNINKKKRRYRHERALFKDENEIDKESLDFFNKVYI